MKGFKRILLGMDLSNMDLKLLDYLKLIAKIQQPEKVYCSHVVRELDLPSYVVDELGEMKAAPLDERLRKNLAEEISLKIRPSEMDIDIDILEGKLSRQLLHWTEVKGIDLAILGKKKLATSLSGKRFLRGSKCSVLFVPEGNRPTLKRIGIATDFSPTSSYVLKEALNWIEKMEEKPQLDLIHIYDVPSGVRAQLGDLPEILLNRIRNTHEEFVLHYLEKLEIDPARIKVHLVENNHINPAKHILSAAQSNKLDLLILGAYGHSFIGNLLIGSVSEKVLELDTNIPLLIMRPPKSSIEKIPAFGIRTFKQIDYA